MKPPVKKPLRRTLAVLLSAALLATCIAIVSNETSSAVDYSVIRVKLSVGSPTSFSFSLSGNYSIEEYPSLNLSGGSYTVKLESGALKLYSGSSLLYSATKLKIVERTPPSGGVNLASIKTTTYGTHDYRGDIQFIISSGAIAVVNYVYLEYYLYGVVPHEMSNTWPADALKAQAVAARTYAVRYITGTGTYDVVDTASNQVYKGYSASYDNAIAAVDATAKQVLMSNGKLVQAYFSASNGGYTEIPQHVWSASAALQPYHVIQEDPYDVQNTWSEQEVLIFPKTISSSSSIDYQYMSSGSMVKGTGNQSASATMYFKISALSAVAAKGYTASVSGDIEIAGFDKIVAHTWEDQHDIADYNGNNACVCFEKADVTMRVYASRPATEQERNDTGADTVREQVTVTFTIDLHVLDGTSSQYRAFSNSSLRLFVVTETSTGWNIYHRRYGHGVGLSQRGAQTRAKSGQTWKQILSFYYPSATLETLNISAPVPQAPVQDNTNAVIVNCTTGVNVRSTPDTSRAAIGMALLGARITVTQPYINAEWHQIDFGGVQAYINAYYVKLDAPSPTSAVTPVVTPTATPTVTPVLTPTATPTATPASTPTATPTAAATAKPTATATAAVSPTATAASPVIAATGTVTTSTLNVRSGPGTSYTKLGTLTKNAAVSIVTPGSAGGWHKIWYNNREAYVYASYVKITTPVIAATGTVTSSTLNVRSGPGTSYTSLGKLSKGASVSIISAGGAGGWHKIWYNSREAYVYADYVKTAVAVECTGVVTSSVLNVRSGPGTSYSKLGSLSKGATIEVIQRNASGQWHKIRYNGAEAYVHADYVKLSGGYTQTDTTPTAAVYATVNANRLNLRKTDSMDGTVITTLTRNTVVQVLEQGGTWMKVRYSGVDGYVYASYMQLSGATYAKVTCSTLNVRSGASTSSSVLGMLKKGEVVQVIEKGSTWHKILYQSVTAYVYAAYIAF